MKVVAKQNEYKEAPEYPCFKMSLNDGTIVLFTSKNTGIVVCQGRIEYDVVGRVCDDWAESHFVPFYGIITVSKD